MVGNLRRELAAHKLRTGRDGDDLVFGRERDKSFIRTTTRRRALKAWEDAGLEPITPHEARHCAASYFIAAGLDPKQVSTFVGQTDVRTTYAVYGHILPGGEAEAGAKLDAFHARQSEGQ